MTPTMASVNEPVLLTNSGLRTSSRTLCSEAENTDLTRADCIADIRWQSSIGRSLSSLAGCHGNRWPKVQGHMLLVYKHSHRCV